MAARQTVESILRNCKHLLRRVRNFVSERSVQVTLACAILGACCFGTCLGLLGIILGGIVGFTCGILLLPITLGLSLPICTTIGATIGLLLGMIVGWIVGSLAGAAVGHFVYSKRDNLWNGAVQLAASFHAHLTSLRASMFPAAKCDIDTTQAETDKGRRSDIKTAEAEADKGERYDSSDLNLQQCDTRKGTLETLKVLGGVVFALMTRIKSMERKMDRMESSKGRCTRKPARTHHSCAPGADGFAGQRVHCPPPRCHERPPPRRERVAEVSPAPAEATPNCSNEFRESSELSHRDWEGAPLPPHQSYPGYVTSSIPSSSRSMDDSAQQ